MILSFIPEKKLISKYHLLKESSNELVEDQYFLNESNSKVHKY